MTYERKYNERYPRSEIREEIIWLRSTHPDWTLEQIGNEVGRTRERVRQVLLSENMEARSAKAAYARQPIHLKKGKPCKRCGTPVPYVAYKQGGHYNIFCSKACAAQQHVELTCGYCEKVYELTTSQARSRNKRVTTGRYKATYCSHSCSSRAYWDVAKRKTPNTLGFALTRGPGGKIYNENRELA